MAKAQRNARRCQQGRPGCGLFHPIPKRWPLLLAPVSFLCSAAWAAEWDINPAVSIRETYSDNISLVPDGSKQSEWVTQIIPGVSVSATGARLKFNAGYAPELNYYARGQYENQILQRGNARGTAELAQELLYVDFGATVGQYDVSLQAPLTSNNANTTGNRSTVGSYFVSPYLLRDFGSDVRAEARFTGSVVDSDDETSLADSLASRIDLRLKSGDAYKLLTWDIEYGGETIDYKNGQDGIVSEVVTANARRLITPGVGLLAQAGHETYRTGDVAPKSGGGSWSAGLEWTPSPRTRVRTTAGHRFYGDAYAFEFSHRSRLTTWGAGYNEDVTTTRSEFLVPSGTTTAGYLDTLFTSQYPDPVARKKAVDEFIARTGLPPNLGDAVNFFNSQLFLVKRWQASAGILGIRNVLIANVFRETRNTLVGNIILPGAGDFAAGSDVDQNGAGFQWNLRLTPRDAWNLGAEYSRNAFSGTGRTDKVLYVGMGLTRQFQPRLSGSLNYRRQQKDSNESTSSYTENALFANLTMRF